MKKPQHRNDNNVQSRRKMVIVDMDSGKRCQTGERQREEGRKQLSAPFVFVEITNVNCKQETPPLSAHSVTEKKKL